MTQERVPVLIVGAGGAGLSLSLLLLQQGLHPLLIERRSDISIYPRARNLNFRTLEVFRGLGLAAEVRAVGTTVSQVIFKETLASSKQANSLDPSTLMQHSEALSPDPFGWHCPQSRLEPLLLAAAKQRGGDVRYSTELVSFTQDDAGVMATLEEHATRRSYVVRSDYLIAADGAHSHIRAALGIPSQGIGELPEYFIFVYFRAPWDELIAGHEADAVVIKSADVQGIFLVGGKNLGMFLITYRPALGESFQDFTAEHCKDLVQKAIGKPDMAVEIVDIANWQPAESVASQFQQGRVFLVGDAAHTMRYSECAESGLETGHCHPWTGGSSTSDNLPGGAASRRMVCSSAVAHWTRRGLAAEGNKERTLAFGEGPPALLSHCWLPLSLPSDSLRRRCTVAG